MRLDMNKKQSRWQSIVRAFQGKTIGVFGDFMLDEVLRGEATRISPEAPVPVVLLEGLDSCEGYPGGAGNVAADIAALDGRPIPWGVIGSDECGRRLLRLLVERGIRCNTLVSEAGRVTPRKVRIVARQHQLLRLDFEKISPASPHSSAQLLESFKRWVSRLEALIISDYQKGLMTRPCAIGSWQWLVSRKCLCSSIPNPGIRIFAKAPRWRLQICMKPNKWPDSRCVMR